MDMPPARQSRARRRWDKRQKRARRERDRARAGRHTERKKCGREHRRQAPAAQEPCAGHCRGKMQQAVCPQMNRALPGSSLQRRRVLDDEEGGRVQPHQRREAAPARDRKEIAGCGRTRCVSSGAACAAESNANSRQAKKPADNACTSAEAVKKGGRLHRR